MAMTLLQPWAMLAKGPPWMMAGLFSSVCTRFGSRDAFRHAGAKRKVGARFFRLIIGKENRHRHSGPGNDAEDIPDRA